MLYKKITHTDSSTVHEICAKDIADFRNYLKDYPQTVKYALSRKLQDNALQYTY